MQPPDFSYSINSIIQWPCSIQNWVLDYLHHLHHRHLLLLQTDPAFSPPAKPLRNSKPRVEVKRLGLARQIFSPVLLGPTVISETHLSLYLGWVGGQLLWLRIGVPIWDSNWTTKNYPLPFHYTGCLRGSIIEQLLSSPHKWVVSHPLYTLNNQDLFHCSVGIPTFSSSHFGAWTLWVIWHSMKSWLVRRDPYKSACEIIPIYVGKVSSST